LLIIYFHGNAEDIGNFAFLNNLSNTLKVHIAAVEYPGYGIYKGKPNFL